MKAATFSAIVSQNFSVIRGLFLLTSAVGLLLTHTACSTTGSTAGVGGASMDRPVAIGAVSPSSVLPIGKPVIPRLPNDCLPQAIGMQQTLAAQNISSQIMVVQPASGLAHATLVFEFDNNSYVWDTQWGAAQVANASSAQALAQEWLSRYGIPGASRNLVSSYFIQ